MSQSKIAAAVITPLPLGLYGSQLKVRTLDSGSQCQLCQATIQHLGWWRPHILPQGREELSWATCSRPWSPPVCLGPELLFVVSVLYESVLLLSQRGSLTSIPCLTTTDLLLCLGWLHLSSSGRSPFLFIRCQFTIEVIAHWSRFRPSLHCRIKKSNIPHYGQALVSSGQLNTSF